MTGNATEKFRMAMSCKGKAENVESGKARAKQRKASLRGAG
jgi:hypothetical protein